MQLENNFQSIANIFNINNISIGKKKVMFFIVGMSYTFLTVTIVETHHRNPRIKAFRTNNYQSELEICGIFVLT